jgi:hypothetical protein
VSSHVHGCISQFYYITTIIKKKILIYLNFEKIRLLLMQITDTYTNSKKETLKIKSLNEMQLSEYNKVKYFIFTYIFF